MNRMRQLQRYRQRNEQKKLLELMREIYRQKRWSLQEPTTVVQDIRKQVLLDSMMGHVRS